MSQLSRRFLAEDPARIPQGNTRALALAAFGKHPGWDDHIEDLGLETETLIQAKSALYVHGVGGQIDAGAWEKLDPSSRIESFNHAFVWQRQGQFLLGRLWSSRDGKGRTRYPMVLCAHCLGASLDWALRVVLPKLQEIEAACKLALTAAEVRDLLDRTRSSLRSALADPAAAAEYAPAAATDLQRFVSDPAFGPDRQGWFRIYYQLCNHLAPFNRGTFNAREGFGDLRPQEVRLPRALSNPHQAFILWTRLLSLTLDNDVPMLLALSPDLPCIDVILGAATSPQFFCLRAAPAALPLATEVPYEIDAQLRAHTTSSLTEFLSGKDSPRSSSAPGPTLSSSWFSVTSRWFKGGKKK